MMNVSLRKIMAISLFFNFALVACTPNKMIKQPVSIVASKQVVFDKINVQNTKNGIKVSGQVKKRSPSNKRIKIPGHIHVSLKNATGEVLEKVTARTHRLYKRGTIWHFDGVLTKALPVGSVMVVEHHRYAE